MGSTSVTHVSHCYGYGGIDLALAGVFGGDLVTVAACEIEAYAVANALAKVEAGRFGHDFPFWTDIKTFPFGAFHGLVDIYSAGFPCQPFSAAGKRAADDDPRHLWPFIRDGISRMRPELVFLENVEGIISAKLKGDNWSDPEGTPVLLHVLRELERLGYEPEAGVFSAAEVGASHQRKRVFILGRLADGDVNRQSQLRRVIIEGWGRTGDFGEALADRSCSLRQRNGQPRERLDPFVGEEVDDSMCRCDGRRQQDGCRSSEIREIDDGGGELADSEDNHRGREQSEGTEGGRRCGSPRSDSNMAHSKRPSGSAQYGIKPGRRSDSGPDQVSMLGGCGVILDDTSRYVGGGFDRQEGSRRGVCEDGSELAHASGDDQRGDSVSAEHRQWLPIGGRRSDMEHSEYCGCEVGKSLRSGTASALPSGIPLFPPGPGLGGSGVVDDILKLFRKDPEAAWRLYQAELQNTNRWIDILASRPDLAPALSEAESALHGMADGAGNRVDRLRLCGNGVVWRTAMKAFLVLSGRLFGKERVA